tara:strand:+ start:1755 stop:2393 length:639 start_codon:yes stop_codon:yes gene_type:complete
MEIGIIINTVPEKRYGFIEKKDGSTVFYHLSDFKNKEDKGKVKIGLVVEFDQIENEKGSKATNIITSDKPFFIKKDFFTRTSKNAKNTNIVYRINNFTTGGYRNPIDAKQKLIRIAQNLGFNCVLNIKKEVQKHQHKNYIYRTYSFSGDFGFGVIGNAQKEDLDVDFKKLEKQFVEFEKKELFICETISDERKDTSNKRPFSLFGSLMELIK